MIGGAQRTVATLRRAASLDTRVETSGDCSSESISWSDVVVLHAWRKRSRSDLNIPRRLRGIAERPVIVFNHDWEGRYEGNADLVLVPSEFAASNWNGPQRVAVLPGGISLDRFLEVAYARTWSAPAVVGRLSTLYPAKISPRTLEYWPRIDAREFLIGGGGSELGVLQYACTDRRFRFAGEIPPSSSHEFFSQIDIFLYDTEWHVESFGYVVLEALAAGCVVVAARRGAISELIDHGRNGFLFDAPEQAVELCNGLLRDPARCRAISEAGIATALRFPAELMIRDFTTHVMQALQRRNVTSVTPTRRFGTGA